MQIVKRSYVSIRICKSFEFLIFIIFSLTFTITLISTIIIYQANSMRNYIWLLTYTPLNFIENVFINMFILIFLPLEINLTKAEIPTAI